MNQNPRSPVNPDSVAPRPAAVEVPGHLGEIVQGRAGAGGPVALVTLPCPELVTRVGYAPARGPLSSGEPVSAKACAAARLALDAIGAEGWGGALAIERPAVPGLGLGSSTAETLGAVRAVAGAFGLRLPPAREAALCVAAEGAVDPLMWERTVLFASREGRVIEELPPLPAMRVVGGASGPPSPTDPADRGFPDLAGLFREISAALRAGDLAALAAASTRSAEANQARNPNRAWEPFLTIARRHGALGVAVSHTGPAIAMILAQQNPADPARELAGIGIGSVLDYRLGG